MESLAAAPATRRLLDTANAKIWRKYIVMIIFRRSMFGKRAESFHLFLIYGLFRIPPQRWFDYLPLQTAANYAEQVRIAAYVAGTRSK